MQKRIPQKLRKKYNSAPQSCLSLLVGAYPEGTGWEGLKSTAEARRGTEEYRKVPTRDATGREKMPLSVIETSTGRQLEEDFQGYSLVIVSQPLLTSPTTLLQHFL